MFWIRYKNEFPGSSTRLARHVLCIPATCAFSETVFSLSGKVCK